MGGTNERKINAGRNRGPERSNSQPRSSPQLDIDKRSSEQPENARQTADRADARDAIHRNARFCKQEGQSGEVEAVNHSEGQNEQAEDPGRRPSALNRHVQQSLAKSLSQQYRKGEAGGRVVALGFLERVVGNPYLTRIMEGLPVTGSLWTGSARCRI